MNLTAEANAVLPAGSPVLSWSRPRALTIQAALLFLAAFALPAAMHAAGLPVRLLLPMHWPVLLAGLVYGWRSGALIGALAPAISYALSGWPRPAVLPAMILELALYGFLAGFLRERLRWNGFAAITAALLAGRALFLLAAFTTGWTGPDLPAYLATAIAPGLVAALLQIALLPPLARFWVARQDERPPRP
jgi:hypothetical protein